MESNKLAENKTYNFFEYQNKENIFNTQNESVEFEKFLDQIWKKRESTNYFRNQEKIVSENQRFFEINHISKHFKSKKIVGVIHYDGNVINMFPKIMYQNTSTLNEDEQKNVHLHILWWLSYASKIKFPKNLTSLANQRSDFFEMLIFVFAKYTKDLLSQSIYQRYEEISSQTTFVKGRLNFNEYIAENISKANWHKFDCTYDSFEIDNKFNRIIKYVCNLLLKQSKNEENRKYLKEILFVLDDVSDLSFEANDCKSISFNPAFEAFETVRDYCFMFLNQSVTYSYKNDLKLFAFLIPMDSLFENFIYNFLEKEQSQIFKSKTTGVSKNINISSQTSNVFLDAANQFQVKPDIIVQIDDNQKFIIDTKYKIFIDDISNIQKQIAQSDLYQMISYAIRFKIPDVFLIYPKKINQSEFNFKTIEIKDEFATEIETIKIEIKQINIINHKLIQDLKLDNSHLKQIFENTRLGLIEQFQKIFNIS